MAMAMAMATIMIMTMIMGNSERKGKKMGEKKIVIVLTGRPPVRISDDHWPVIAEGMYEWHDGEIRQQANRHVDIYIRVRQHADGRAIVYGHYGYDTHFTHEQSESQRVGSLLAPGGDIPAAISEIAAQLIDRVSDNRMHRHIRDVANDCIADLPPQDI
jgi:hypothetical protein